MSPAVSTNPSEITVSREKREMHVRWQDGHESVYGFDLLRQECPCALCNDQRGKQATAGGPGLVVVSGPILKAGDVQVTEARPVGRYAINFVWSDGHDTGIYSYTFLREACPCPACRGSR
ncbi:MAG: DUF971 domain-containing protein [candidate division NC10 bacterium]|nr:DUF971 domain-containing protein [candidate division NC10 bacterium]